MISANTGLFPKQLELGLEQTNQIQGLPSSEAIIPWSEDCPGQMGPEIAPQNPEYHNSSCPRLGRREVLKSK